MQEIIGANEFFQSHWWSCRLVTCGVRSRRSGQRPANTPVTTPPTPHLSPNMTSRCKFPNCEIKIEFNVWNTLDIFWTCSVKRSRTNAVALQNVRWRKRPSLKSWDGAACDSSRTLPPRAKLHAVAGSSTRKCRHALGSS